MPMGVGTGWGMLLLGTALAARREAVPTVDPCGLDQIYAPKEAEALAGMVFEIGNGNGSTRDASLEAARADARLRFLERYACQDVAPGEKGRCDAIRQNTVPWSGNARQDGRRSWTACATAAIPQAEVEQIERAVETFDAQMIELARAIQAQAGDVPLSLMSPTWESGCSAGEEGAAVLGALRRGFASLETRPKLRANLGDAGPTDRRVWIQLHAQRDEVVVNASLLELDGCVATPVESLRFPGYLLDVVEGDAGRCAVDALLGTVSRGVCAPALSARVEVGTPNGVVCEGEVVEPRLTVSAPAHVQVFGVDARGEAQQLFPMDGASDLVEGQLSLGRFDAVHDAESGETRLVVLAVPQGERFGRTQGWNGWCAVTGGWSSGLIPSNAASVASTYEVLPASHPSCKGKVLRSYEHEDPPVCGAGR